MADEIGQQEKDHALYLDERKQLIDAARESARTFDKAVLAFGSAVFGFSIAFVKDIAPRPALNTLKWLGASWVLFSLGLLTILFAFLFSQRACMFEIEEGGKALTNSEHERKANPWSFAVNCCNYLCVGLIFFGLLCWSVFAFKNLSQGEMPMNKVNPPPAASGLVPSVPAAPALSNCLPAACYSPPPWPEKAPLAAAPILAAAPMARKAASKQTKNPRRKLKLKVLQKSEEET